MPPRSGGDGCFVSLPSTHVIALAPDEEAIYALLGSDAHAISLLVRIEN